MNEIRLDEAFFNLKQGNNSVGTYLQELNEAVDNLRGIDKFVTDRQKYLVFLKGLSPKHKTIRIMLENQDGMTFEKAVGQMLTHEVREQQEEEEEQSGEAYASYRTPFRGRGKFRGGRGGSRGFRGGRQGSSREHTPAVVCYNCNREGHYSRNCPDLRDGGMVTCNTCGGKGHMSFTCPKAGKANSAERAENFVVEALTGEGIPAKRGTWIVDSGATHHMCNERSLLFEDEEQQATNEVVVADKSTLKVEKQGKVKMRFAAEKGEFVKGTINGVLLIPELSRNLFSVTKAMQQGKDVHFDCETMTCRIMKGKEVVGTAHLENRLWILDVATEAPPSTYLAAAEEKRSVLHQKKESAAKGEGTRSLQKAEEVRAFAYVVTPHGKKPLLQEKTGKDRGINLQKAQKEDKVSEKPKLTVEVEDLRKSCQQRKQTSKILQENEENVRKGTLQQTLNEEKVRNFPAELKEKATDAKRSCKVEEKHLHNGKVAELTQKLQVVEFSLKGPINPISKGGFKYYLTITDCYSRKTWTYLLRSKDEAFGTFRIWRNKAEKESGTKLKKLTIQLRGNYLSDKLQTYLKFSGIRYELLDQNEDQQSNRKEDSAGNVLEMARKLLSDAELEKSMWGEAVLAATYLRNGRPQECLHELKAPNELWSGRKSSYDDLWNFGCGVTVKIPENRKQSDGKTGWRGTIVGFESYGTYRIWSPQEQRVVISKDVVFDEQMLNSSAKPCSWKQEIDKQENGEQENDEQESDEQEFGENEAILEINDETKFQVKKVPSIENVVRQKVETGTAGFHVEIVKSKATRATTVNVDEKVNCGTLTVAERGISSLLEEQEVDKNLLEEQKELKSSYLDVVKGKAAKKGKNRKVIVGNKVEKEEEKLEFSTNSQVNKEVAKEKKNPSQLEELTKLE